MDQQTSPTRSRPGIVRAPQNVIAGLILMALAATAFWLLGDLSQGTLGAIGPALLRPVQLGSVTTPGLGLVVAGPLAIFISGFATPETRIRELLILALGLTAFCMVLFGDVLNLSIPVFPQPLAGLLPDDWTQRTILRVMAAALVAGAVIVWLLGRLPVRRT